MRKKKNKTEDLPESTPPVMVEQPEVTETPAVKAEPVLTIRGLMPRKRMPVRFRSHDYDLANLSEEDEAYLRQFPESFPYLD